MKKFGDIEKAKNIKNRYKKLEYIYDNSCKKIDSLHVRFEEVHPFLDCNLQVLQQPLISFDLLSC